MSQEVLAKIASDLCSPPDILWGALTGRMIKEKCIKCSNRSNCMHCTWNEAMIVIDNFFNDLEKYYGATHDQTDN